MYYYIYVIKFIFFLLKLLWFNKLEYVSLIGKVSYYGCVGYKFKSCTYFLIFIYPKKKKDIYI